MKRALAARAKHDPNGLATPGGEPMPGQVLSSSPLQHPLKISKTQSNQVELLSSLDETKPMPNDAMNSEVSVSSHSISDQVSNVETTEVIQKGKTESVPPSPNPACDDISVNSAKNRSSKRQRGTPSGLSEENEEEGEKSAFFLKYQNAALASELYQLRHKLKALEEERDFRREQCHNACQALHSLEATWNAMEVALQLGNKPSDEEEPEVLNVVSTNAPASTGTGESVELIGALLDSLAAIGKDCDLAPREIGDNHQLDIQKTANSVSKRATALQRWIWGLLRKVTAEDSSGKHPLLKLAKLEAKLTAVKSQIRDFQFQIAEMAKSRDEAIQSEMRVRRSLYRLSTGRLKLREIMEAIETDGSDGLKDLFASEEKKIVQAAESSNKSDYPGDNSEISDFRKKIRDLEEIAAAREKQIADLTIQREENQKRINSLALPPENTKSLSHKELSEDEIKSSKLFVDLSVQLNISEGRLDDMKIKLENARRKWAEAIGDAEFAARSVEEHILKHKKKWAEITGIDESGGAETFLSALKVDESNQAGMIAELEHKLNQALENVRRADVIRASLDEMTQLNSALQARLEDCKTKNTNVAATTKLPSSKPEVPSGEQEVGTVKAEAISAERLQKEHRRMRKDLAAALQSKENAKARLEKSEKERDNLIKTNSRLIKQSAEKDEMNAKSLSTILHLKSLTEKLALEKDLLEQQVKSSGQLNLAARLASHAREKLVDEMFNKEKEFDNKISLLETECEKIKENYEMTIGQLDMKKAELSIIEKDASTAKQRCDELVSELMLQEVEKRKILETLAVAQRDASESAKIVAQLRTQKFGEDGTSIFTTDQLTTQISVLKGRLSCPVCNHRDKSCIILRCRHMFCKHCLDESIKNRNRKCPSCGQRFDTKDVEDIWL